MTTKKVNGQRVDEKSDKPAEDKGEAAWLHTKVAAIAKATDLEFPEAPIFWLALRFTDGRVVLLRSDASGPHPTAIRVPTTPDASRPFTLTAPERESVKLSVDAYADLNAGLVAIEAASMLRSRDTRGRKAGGK
jgi:hypothetical protein